MNALEAVSTSVLITKAWHAAGIFRKTLTEYSDDKEIIIQYHEIDIENAKKIRVFNEENKQRVKSFAEGLTHKTKHDMPRFTASSSRFKVHDQLNEVQIAWFKAHRDEFVDINKIIN